MSTAWFEQDSGIFDEMWQNINPLNLGYIGNHSKYNIKPGTESDIKHNFIINVVF